MRSLALASLLLCLGLPATAASTNAVPLPSGPMTLDQALEYALSHNVTLRKGRQDLEEAQGLSIQQRSARLPRLGMTGNYQQLDEGRIERVQFSAAQPAMPFMNNQSWNANLVVTQPIYAGGKYNSLARSSRLTREASLAAYQALVANTLLEVRVAYSDVLLSVEQIAVQEASKKLLERELETARRSLEAGSVPKFNVLRAEVELANALPPLIRARNQERIARNTLALLLGCDIPTDSGVDIPLRTADSLRAEPFEISVGAALNAAWIRRPEIKAAQVASQLRHEEVLQTRADLLPSLSGTAGYGVQNRNFIRDLDRTLDGWTVGVQANWLPEPGKNGPVWRSKMFVGGLSWKCVRPFPRFSNPRRCWFRKPGSSSRRKKPSGWSPHELMQAAALSWKSCRPRRPSSCLEPNTAKRCATTRWPKQSWNAPWERVCVW
jgi:outer membrane protein TolC